MAADIVAIELGLTDGDVVTLWAPRWRDGGDEWEAFLGSGEELFGFAGAADLVTYVRDGATGGATEHDLLDHPAWATLAHRPAEGLDPDATHRFDLVGVPELLAAAPTAESVQALNSTLAVTSSLGQVCDLTAVTKFFNGNPQLAALAEGADSFAGRDGAKRWTSIGTAVARGWDGVVDAVDGVVVVQQVDAAASEKAAAELDAAAAQRAARAADEPETGADGPDDAVSADGSDETDPDGATAVAGSPALGGSDVVLGSDADFWEKVGIDPVRLVTGAGVLYTLRCYYDDAPIFLGRNGRISVFTSERSLARYLADEHDHDLSDLATYDNIRTAATDGSLRVEVDDANVYVLTGISDDLADGPDTVDPDQLALAMELLRDVADYSEDSSVAAALEPDAPVGAVAAHVLDGAPAPSSAPVEAVTAWERLEAFVDGRLRRE